MISEYVSQMAKRGGMAKSTGYAIEFALPDSLKGYLKTCGIEVDNKPLWQEFCDEASLPASNAATGQVTGRYLGEGSVSYPHTKMYTDISLSWMADANMEPYKFVQAWWQYIFGEFDQEGELYDAGGYYSETKDKLRNRSTRLRFPKEYNAGIVIVKAERGVNSEIDRQSQAHVIQEAYPYSVDSVPLSFGMDSLVKVTANFHYSKHFVKYTDQRTA
tara:strand:+ start:319 stop:969 length:651 start_codon:yes stop_codon:yes gene_type:complete